MNLRRYISLLLAIMLFIGMVPYAQATEVSATEETMESTEPTMDSTAPVEPTEPAEDVADDDNAIAPYASTQKSILLFDYTDNGDYTTRLNSQIAVSYKLNGTGATKTAYIKNLGWHFARYNNTPYPDDPLYCIEPWRNYGASTSGSRGGDRMKFQTETDLVQIKGLAKCFLYLAPEETEFSPMIVHHPFSNSGFVGLRDEAGDVQIGNIWENADDRVRWQGQTGKFIDDSTDVFEIYSRIEKPYALAFLKYATPFLSQKDFSLILGDAWLRSEQPNHDPNLSQKQLLNMFSFADPKVLMEDVERKRLAELDGVVTVYRGTHSDKPNSEWALSWTLNRDTAQWFANRYGKDGSLYEAKIEKKHIHALFLRREESEVILDPKYLTEIVQVPKMDMEQTM